MSADGRKNDKFSARLEQLVQALTVPAAGTSGQFGSVLVVRDRQRGAGTAIPLPGAIATATRNSQIVVPASSVPSPMDYAGIYLTLREYIPDLPFPGADAARAIQLFGRQQIVKIGRDEMIGQLCSLGAIAQRPALLSELTDALRDSLTPNPGRASWAPSKGFRTMWCSHDSQYS